MLTGATAAHAQTITFATPATARADFAGAVTAVADLNRDGVLDLVVLSFDETLTVLLGDPITPGTYLPPGVPLPTVAFPVDLVIADLNRDGVPDLVVINCSCAAPLSIFFGNGDGTFALRDDRDFALEPYALAIGDLNRDGVLDLVMSSNAVMPSDEANKVGILLGNVSAPGTFLPLEKYRRATAPAGCASATSIATASSTSS